MRTLPNAARDAPRRPGRLAGLAPLLALACLLPLRDAPGAEASAAASLAVGIVGGTATYRERVALTPQAVFEATLEDVSRADAPATVLGRTRIDAPGQVPIRFAIAYDPAKLEGRGVYVVRATIREGERLAFTTDRMHQPFAGDQAQSLQIVMRAVGSRPPALPGTAALGPLPAQFRGILPCADCQGIEQTLDLFPDGGFHWRSIYLGKPPLEAPDDVGRWLFASDRRTLLLFGGREAPVRFVLRDDGALRLLDLEGRPIRSTLNYELRRVAGEFEPFEPRVRLRGAYTYFADAATLLDCATGQRLPVAQEGASLDLERAYLAARQAPGAARIALVEGRIVQRMPMEGPGPRPTLRVDRFLRLAPPGEACPPPPSNAPLEGTRWRLTLLDGEPVLKTGGRKREPFLQFDAGQPRVAASGGCNSLMGAATRDGDQIRFTDVAGTRMVCGEAAMAQEKAFTTVLDQARRWLVVGRLLELEDEEGYLLARFEAATTEPATSRSR